jgi:cell division protein FtsL
MEEKEATIENKIPDKKRKKSNAYILSGGILTEDFVIKQSRLMILIFFLVIAFISNRYSCMKKLTEIEKLTTQLNQVKNECMKKSIELTSNSRQSQIEEMLNKKDINLKVSKSSVYEIK